MKSTEPRPLNSTDIDDLRATVHWSRVYAQNRSLPVLLRLTVFAVLFALLFGLAAGGGLAVKTGHPVLAVLAALIFVVAYGLMMLFVFSKRGREWIDEQCRRLYENEGSAQIESKRILDYRRLGYAAGALFGACITLQVALGLLGYLPTSLMQPVSALYSVPFLVFLWWWQRPASTWVMLLWPTLYAGHALLLMSGLPIPKHDMWAAIHMVGAVCGYGMLAALVSHVYSRYALQRLQDISQGHPSSNGE